MWGVEICKIYSKIMKKYHHCVKFTYPLSFQTRIPKVDQHTGGKWLIHGTKHQCNCTCHGSNWCSVVPHSSQAIMTANSQSTFSNEFSRTKCFVFCFRFHKTLFLRVPLTVSIISSYGLPLNRCQDISRTNANILHWLICAALGNMS